MRARRAAFDRALSSTSRPSKRSACAAENTPRPYLMAARGRRGRAADGVESPLWAIDADE
jgi:hypothetical protein